MKLYLSSYKIGNGTEKLKKWIIDHGNKIMIIANAKDQYTNLERVEKGTLDDIFQLKNIGFEVERLDLRQYFNNKECFENILKNVTAFYVVGGNTFVLRKAMKLSGFDNFLIKNFNNPNILYAGYSAGVGVLSQDLNGIKIMDEPNIDPYESETPPIYNGIGFINKTIIPHFESNHDETEAANKTVEYCIDNNIEYITLKDGDYLFIEPYDII